jgi:hypothetical protein
MLKTYELGANSYARKPVDFEQFMEDEAVGIVLADAE